MLLAFLLGSLPQLCSGCCCRIPPLIILLYLPCNALGRNHGKVLEWMDIKEEKLTMTYCCGQNNRQAPWQANNIL